MSDEVGHGPNHCNPIEILSERDNASNCYELAIDPRRPSR